MEKRKYTHVQALLPEIKAMLADGKTQREVAEYYGFQDKQVVKRLLERERRKGPVDKGNVWAEKSYSQPIFHP
ncbi:hypothetical protein [uncultured Flavonifractor sp.]|uniref:hypothetical protein n=1 Tax=uncultured Flavonifractor sp. TaxID=1193534 RepID=UPI002638D8A1|nr:hypothetical protein [uncultured Flavonifractor sp.]